MPDSRYLVITDLDGTLLDHYSYEWQAARPALDWLQQKHIPLVINTSKTHAEVQKLQKKLNISTPAIVENGSAIFIPKALVNSTLEDKQWIEKEHYFLRVLGKSRDVILTHLHSLRKTHHWKFEGFADWSIKKIAETTNLPIKDAKLASLREFSEALTWLGDDNSFKDFQKGIQQDGLQLLKGGRFFHVLGQSNKGLATLVLKDFYSQYWNSPVNTVVLGDGPNDCDMLDIADIPVAVKSPVHNYPKINPEMTHASVIYTQGYGPVGWNEAISQIRNSIS